VFPLGKLEEAGPQQRAGLEVKAQSRFGDAAALFLGVTSSGVELAEVIERQWDFCVGMHNLRGDTVDERKRGAKDFVAAHDFVDGALQERGMERSGDAEAHGDIPAGIAGFEAVEIPERLLRDGGGETVKRFA